MIIEALGHSTRARPCSRCGKVGPVYRIIRAESRGLTTVDWLGAYCPVCERELKEEAVMDKLSGEG